MAGQVYFGNDNYQTWIDAPQSGMKADAVGYVNVQTGLNGRSFVKRSRASSRSFQASWVGSLNSTTSVNLQKIKDFADGMHGDGPFYFVDPFAARQNVLPPHWATPHLSESDWPQMTSSLTPTYQLTSSLGLNTNNYPYKYCYYSSIPASFVSERKITIIIPPEYTFHFGWQSTTAGLSAASTAGIRIVPYVRSTGAAGTAANPVSILAGGTTHNNYSVSGSATSKVDIFIANGSASSASLNLVSMFAQLRETSDSTFNSQPFINGRGTKALEFSSFPTIEYYSSAINSGQIGMSASFIEVN